MRKLGICVLLAGTVGSFQAIQANDAVLDDPQLGDPAGEIVLGEDGTGTGEEVPVDTLPPELVDPMPEDDGEIIVDEGGIDDGAIVIDEGEIGDGEIVIDEGEIDDGEIVVDDGEIDIGEVVDGTEGDPAGEPGGDGEAGEEIYYTMGPGEEIDPEVVRDDSSVDGEPVPVEGQLPIGDDTLMYATGAPEPVMETAGPVESRDAAADTGAMPQLDEARASEALPDGFPAPMDVIESERALPGSAASH